MKTQGDWRKFMLSAGIFLLLVIFSSCSNDDDGISEKEATVKPTGSFQVDDNQILAGNTLIIRSVTVEQDSWIVAFNVGNETSSGLLAEPLGIEEGTYSNLELHFDEGAISGKALGHEVALKLFAENPNSGIRDQWDGMDPTIRDSSNSVIRKTITVFAENTNADFDAYDSNSSGFLDSSEILVTYQNDLATWDTDGDGFLNSNEFYSTFFSHTDLDDDGRINEEEWDAGFTRMFRNWGEDDFEIFDANADGLLDSEEWESIFIESGWFETYDEDSNSLVTEDEWDAGLFKDWDVNDDSQIDRTEFVLYRPYVIGWFPESETYTFGWYDTNKNGTLDFEEALESYNSSNYFHNHWDSDGNGSLNGNEFYNSFFLNSDYNLDNSISQQEWESGFNALFFNWTEDEFSNFDVNENNRLSTNEWVEIFQESGWFEAYDTDHDEFVSQNEWEKGLFADWDTNANGVIEEDEFDNYIYYVWVWMRW